MSASRRLRITRFAGREEPVRRGYPAWVTRAILSHAKLLGRREGESAGEDAFLRATRWPACDRRGARGPVEVDQGSVLKRIKDKAFAWAVSRDDLRTGAKLGLPLADHAANAIRFMQLEADVLGLRGNIAR